MAVENAEEAFVRGTLVEEHGPPKLRGQRHVLLEPALLHLRAHHWLRKGRAPQP